MMIFIFVLVCIQLVIGIYTFICAVRTRRFSRQTGKAIMKAIEAQQVLNTLTNIRLNHLEGHDDI